MFVEIAGEELSVIEEAYEAALHSSSHNYHHLWIEYLNVLISRGAGSKVRVVGHVTCNIVYHYNASCDSVLCHMMSFKCWFCVPTVSTRYHVDTILSSFDTYCR